MNRLLKKYSSFFLLGIFLFAYTEKGIHDIIHADDEHCNALHEKHFHNQEHHCFICDFNISIFDDATANIQPSFTRCASHISYFGIVQQIALQTISASSTRGPPYIA